MRRERLDPNAWTSEHVGYIKRLLRIEQAKAKERELAGVKDPSENSHKGRSDEATAEQFGISSNTMRRELFIADNKDRNGATHQPTSTTN